MSDALRQAVDHYTRTHADAAGIAPTPVPGLFLVRGTAPGGLEHIIACPLVCLVRFFRLATRMHRKVTQNFAVRQLSVR